MFGRSQRLGAIAVLALALASAPALGNPFIIEAPASDLQFQSAFGLRYWYGLGGTSKNFLRVYARRVGLPADLSAHPIALRLEAFGRVDHSSGLFWKGYADSRVLTAFYLQDEDFPPLLSPYSSTNSTLQSQALGYINFDFGGALVRGTDFRLDGFVGYHYFHRRMKAFGCQQTASNPTICAGTIPNSVAAIVEDDTWQGARVGLNLDIPLVDRFTSISKELGPSAYVWFSGTDNHLLRPDLPLPIPEDGHGWGYQLEAMLSYQYDQAVCLGAGVRYWSMQSKGYSHFEAVGSSLQPLDFKANIYGVFLQGGYRFGPF